jgi:hypothetical protein
LHGWRCSFSGRKKYATFLNFIFAGGFRMAGNSMTTVGLLLVLTMGTVVAEAQDHTVKIRVIHAKTGEPVSGERLTVALGEEQTGSIAMATDRTGTVRIDPGTVRTIRIVPNVNADCRGSGESSKSYSVAAIRRTGITTGNVCGNAHNPAAPGELILFEATKPASTPMVKIRVINAKTNKPVTDESLNVALRVDQIGSVAMATDQTGIIEVETGEATMIRILSNMYADCRPRGELYTNYSLAEIRRTGITTGNLCSSAQPVAKPGELILFEIPKRYVPTYPALPGNSIPHSDERPQSQ